MNNDKEYQTSYKVVINRQQQYSLLLADWENNPGWEDTGKSGSLEECLAYIKKVWTDMRPLRLRQKAISSQNTD